jgi:2-polyprenyl-3-methyl-5-hydroxy-6-metoxy-1,4-benzoquinol methylase
MSDIPLKMDDQARADTIEKYRRAYSQHGYSPTALGWDKGRQDIRFEVLLSFFECRGKSILDIGCGFGDLNRVLSQNIAEDYSYTGVDLVSELIDEGRHQYPQEHIRFINSDFLEYQFTQTFDIVVASGIFNHKFENGGNDLFIEMVLNKAWSICKEGFAFDFLSDKVDYRYSHTHHSSPEQILGLSYELSRNVSLKNDYMPFEFCICVGKDDSFDRADAVFNSHKRRTGRV